MKNKELTKRILEHLNKEMAGFDPEEECDIEEVKQLVKESAETVLKDLIDDGRLCESYNVNVEYDEEDESLCVNIDYEPIANLNKIELKINQEEIDLDKTGISKYLDALKAIIEAQEKPKRWRDDENKTLNGYYIDSPCNLRIAFKVFNTKNNYNVFATEKQAKAALAMARISQIMKNDKRFGGVITDEEWKHPFITKYSLCRQDNKIKNGTALTFYRFLAFHTKEQRNLFLKENEDLVKAYFMID